MADRRPVFLVVFGAGASYNVRREDPVRRDGRDGTIPPLTDDLFSSGLRDIDPWGWGYAPWANLIADDLAKVKRSHPDAGFEEALSINYRGLADNTVSRAKRYLGLRLYLWRLFHHFSWTFGRGPQLHNTYQTFCNRVVHHWAVRCGVEVVFVTMNYDTLLERALRNTGVGLAIDQYWKPEEGWAVIKPHGSISWQREYSGLPASARLDTEDDLMDQAAALAQLKGNPPAEADEGNIEGRGWGAYWNGREPGKVILPALELPFENDEQPKSALTNCPAAHLEYLDDALGRVIGSAIIGWSGQDAHIVERLAPAMQRVRVEVVDPIDPLIIRDHLSGAWPDAQVEPIKRTFYEYAADHGSDLSTLLGKLERRSGHS